MESYTLLLAAGASLGVWRIYQHVPVEQRNEYLNHGILLQFMMLIGARLAHVALRWEYYQDFPQRIFKFSEGGLAAWGAIGGGLLGFIIILLIAERQPLQVIDALTPMLTPLAVCLWLASWQAGIAYSTPLSTHPWWALLGTDENGIEAPRFPLQLAAALSLLLILGWFELRQPFHTVVGMQSAGILCLFGLINGLFTLLRADPGVHWGLFRPDLWAYLLLAGAGLVLLGSLGFREVSQPRLKQ